MSIANQTTNNKQARERFLKNIDGVLTERESARFTGKIVFEVNLSQGGLVDLTSCWQYRQRLIKKEA